MNIAKLKQWRRPSLALFVVGVIAFVALLSLDHRTLFIGVALVTFGSLGFFVFTEGFLFSPPERAKTDIWLARLFFFLIVPVVLGLAIELVTRSL